ncbi:MAG: ThuA domain-containing protein [Kiritimatiellae bacterium]|nr:ThuA domain-containing protein [Kiritimatiellia bacterium]MDD5519826.1 ThuA domain-containing protein [Kiritimatiellia bacterium]
MIRKEQKIKNKINRRSFLASTAALFAASVFFPARVSTAAVTVPAGPVLSQEKPATPGQKNILLVTGCDYPGHPWKLLEPILRDTVGKDQRMHVTVTEDPRFMASPDLKNYDAILLNYMNWKNPGPGAEAQEGLRKAVNGGTGLVMVHFTCGAFQDWPEFVKLAGRIWNPKFRGHDPRGEFKVEITDKAHPITAGMEDFQTFDELYTCLDGNEPIHVIAKAISKVDKKDYPMAFTREYGKGRVFQSVLGHDPKAFEQEAVKKLFRRACAWAAGLEPKE